MSDADVMMAYTRLRMLDNPQLPKAHFYLDRDSWAVAKWLREYKAESQPADIHLHKAIIKPLCDSHIVVTVPITVVESKTRHSAILFDIVDRDGRTEVTANCVPGLQSYFECMLQDLVECWLEAKKGVSRYLSIAARSRPRVVG